MASKKPFVKEQIVVRDSRLADRFTRRPVRRQRKFVSEPLLGTRIKALAVLRGYSLRELALAAGINYDRLRNITYGSVESVHWGELHRINAVLAGNLHWITEGIGDPLRPRKEYRAAARNPDYDYALDDDSPWARFFKPPPH